MVCMFVERVKEYRFTSSFFQSEWFGMSEFRCCVLVCRTLLFSFLCGLHIHIIHVFKMFLCILVQIVPRYFLILYNAVSSFWGIALYKSYHYYYMERVNESPGSDVGFNNSVEAAPCLERFSLSFMFDQRDPSDEPESTERN